MLRERSADVEADGRLELGAQRRDVDVARDHQPERDVSDLDGSAYLLQKRDELEVSSTSAASCWRAADHARSW